MELIKLSNIEFKNLYDTHKDNVATDFYEKALCSAKYYDRVSAFFSSKILSRYSLWIENLYNSQWKIRFIFSEVLSESDFDLMKKWYDARAIKILDDDFSREALDESDKINLSNLAFLIEQGLIDIKVAFVKPWILHDKMWLIYDDENNSIYFRWSNNETVAALEANHESFEVSCSWDWQEKENEKIIQAHERFEQLWNDVYDENIKVISIPDVILKKVATYNKWRLVYLEELSYNDAIVADITDDWVFYVSNNLKDWTDITVEFNFENFINFYIKETSDNTYIFWKINYTKINTILWYFSELADDIWKSFYETHKLKQYLEDKLYEIEEYRKLWYWIKRKETFVMRDYDEFSKIVNNELERELREKQMWDAFFICEMVKSANYSVPGAGKTSIVYWAYAYLSSQTKKKINKMVVIWPISSFKSWIDEFKACFWDKRELNVLNTIMCDSKKEKISKLKNNKYDIILVNYESLDSLKWVLAEIIDSKTLLVFDEVHKVKAIWWVWASAALSICWWARYKVVLSWTPIPNWYIDLYNQLNILYTDEYDTFFYKMTPAALSKKDKFFQEEINDKIYPFFCRTTKKELNVPNPNEDIKIISIMSEDEIELFSMIHKKYHNNILLLYIRLLQASTNPKLLLWKIDKYMIEDLYQNEDENEEKFQIDSDLVSISSWDKFEEEEIQFIKNFNMTSKFWLGIEKIKELVSQWKTVMVRWIFVDTLKTISNELSKLWIPNWVICWEVEALERENLIEQFKSKEIKVLIANPHTMAESVSLHKNCHDAIYFEYSFNLTHLIQSKDRIHRLWLPENQYTQYYFLFLTNEWEEDSVDLKTYDRLQEKWKVMNNVVEGERILNIEFDALDEIQAIMKKN